MWKITRRLMASDTSSSPGWMGTTSPMPRHESREGKMPHADIDKLAKDPKVENIQDLFTVNMIVKFLQSKVG